MTEHQPRRYQLRCELWERLRSGNVCRRPSLIRSAHVKESDHMLPSH